jgi:hypothetical protein
MIAFVERGVTEYLESYGRDLASIQLSEKNA